MTIKEWYQYIITEKETLSSLDALSPNPETTDSFINDLKTQSKVAIWRLSAWIFAFAAFTLEQLWEVKEEELIAIQDATPPHTRAWWNTLIKSFQYGDTPIVDDNGKVTYETIDESKQIVKLVSVEDKDGVWNATESLSTVNSVNIYPAKEDGEDVFGNPNYAQLSTVEADALKAYVAKAKPLGIKANVLDGQVGKIQVLSLHLYYDASILNAGGTLVADTSRNILLEQMAKYIAEDVNPTQSINKTRLKSYITQGEGIVDIDLPSGVLNWLVGAVATPVGRNLDINGVCIGWDVQFEPVWYPESKL